MSTAPSMLIPTFVTSPAKPQVRPIAKTSGHAVGVGNCTTSSDMPLCARGSSIAFSFSSAADDVDDSKNHHPDPVDKVPIEREHPELFRVLTLKLPGQRKDEHDRKHRQADNYVTRVQTDQRVERGAKQVGADGQPIVINQLLPFEAGADEKDCAQSHGESPP